MSSHFLRSTQHQNNVGHDIAGSKATSISQEKGMESLIIARDLSDPSITDQDVDSEHVGNLTTEVYYEYIATSSDPESSIILKANAATKDTLVRGLIDDKIFSQVIDFEIEARIIKDDDRLISLCPNSQDKCYLVYVLIIIHHTKDLSANDIRYFILKNCDEIGQTMGFTSNKYIGDRVFTVNLNIKLSGSVDTNKNLTSSDLKMFEWTMEDFISKEIKQRNELIHIWSVYVMKHDYNFKSDTRTLRASDALYELETGVIGEYYSIEIMRFNDIFDEMNNDVDALIENLKDSDAFQFVNDVHIESLTPPEIFVTDESPKKDYKPMLIGFSISLIAILPLIGFIRWKMRRKYNMGKTEQDYVSSVQDINEETSNESSTKTKIDKNKQLLKQDENKLRRKSSDSKSNEPTKNIKTQRRRSSRISPIEITDLVITKASTFDETVLENDKELRESIKSKSSQNLEKHNSTSAIVKENVHSSKNIIIRTPSLSKPKRALSSSKLDDSKKEDLSSLGKKQHSSCKELQNLPYDKRDKKSRGLQNLYDIEKKSTSASKAKTHSPNKELKHLLVTDKKSLSDNEIHSSNKDFRKLLATDKKSLKRAKSFESISNLCAPSKNSKYENKHSSKVLLSNISLENLDYTFASEKFSVHKNISEKSNKSKVDSCKHTLTSNDNLLSTKMDTKEQFKPKPEKSKRTSIKDKTGETNEKIEESELPEIAHDNNKEDDCKVRQHYGKSDKREKSKCDNEESDKDRSHHKNSTRKHPLSHEHTSNENSHLLQKSQDTRPQRRPVVANMSHVKNNGTDKAPVKGDKDVPSSSSKQKSKEITNKPRQRKTNADERKEKASVLMKVKSVDKLEPSHHSIQRRKPTADVSVVTPNLTLSNSLEQKLRPRERKLTTDTDRTEKAAVLAKVKSADKLESSHHSLQRRKPTRDVPVVTPKITLSNSLEQKPRPRERKSNSHRTEKAAVLAKVKSADKLEPSHHRAQRRKQTILNNKDGAKETKPNDSERKSKETDHRPQKRSLTSKPEK